MTYREYLKSLWGDPVGVPVGTRIRFVGGRTILVGDVNQCGGICDDCRDEDTDTEIDAIIPPTPQQGMEPSQ